MYRRKRKRHVACLCRPHYDMITRMHNDSCTPQQCQAQPVQTCCTQKCVQPEQNICAQPVQSRCAQKCVQPVQTSCTQKCVQPVQSSCAQKCVQPVQTSCAQKCAQPVQTSCTQKCAQPVQTSCTQKCAQPVQTCVQPVQTNCMAQPIIQAVPIPQPFANTLPMNPVGQSEAVYWSNTSPRTLPNSYQTSIEDLIRKQVTAEVNKKEHQEPKVVRVESLEDKIKAEVRRYQEPRRERVKIVEASNYLAPRPEPQFCPEETWLLVSSNKTTDKRVEDPPTRHKAAIDTSQDRFFEYYLPPRDDYARRMEKLSNASLEKRLRDDCDCRMDGVSNASLERRMRSKGLTKSEISLLEGVPYCNRRRCASPTNKIRQTYPDRTNDGNVRVEIHIKDSRDNACT